MIYPDNPYKPHWDVFVSIVLIFTCIVTPYNIALNDNPSLGWDISNHVIDGLFLLDIIIIFNTAYYDEEHELIDNRCTIAHDYLIGWFLIDIISILPFDLFFKGNSTNELVRLTKIGRIYKIVKLFKLVRLLKL